MTLKDHHYRDRTDSARIAELDIQLQQTEAEAAELRAALELAEQYMEGESRSDIDVWGIVKSALAASPLAQAGGRVLECSLAVRKWRREYHEAVTRGDGKSFDHILNERDHASFELDAAIDAYRAAIGGK
jgi:small-conductance mechanosensitive channel